MVSLTTASTHLIISPQTLINFNTHFFPSCFLLFNEKTRPNKRGNIVSLSLVAPKESVCVGSFLRFVEVKRRDWKGFCECKNWDSEGDFALEAEILEFMKESEKPEVFPSKKELVDGGRMDLVDAIVRQGGWLASGWDLDDEETEKVGAIGFDVKDWNFNMMEKQCDNGVVERRVESGEESSSFEGSERRSFLVPSFAVNSSTSASSSGRSL